MVDNGYTTTTDPITGLPRVWSIDDFLEADIPRPPSLITGILEAGTANNWSGPPAVGKTWLALAAGLAIAGHRPYLGQFETRPGRVLIVDQESHPAGLQQRLRMLNRADPLPAGSPLSLVVTSGLYVDADVDDPSGGYWQLGTMIDTHRPDLVILDSFVRLHRVNENDSGAVADVNERLKRLVTARGAALILIDHSRKPSPMGGNDDPGARLRGSSEKLAFVDGAMTVAASKTEPGSLIVTPTKRRWGAMPEPFGVRLDVDEVEGTARLSYAGAVSADETATPGQIVEAIVALKTQAGEDAATRMTIAGWLGISESTVRKHLPKLQAIGLVIPRKRPKEAGAKGRPADCYDLGEPK